MELNKDDLGHLIWIYQQVRDSPDLLLRYAGSGYRLETIYRSITETIERLEKELAKIEAKEVR